jgi:hypothetical protein
MYYSFILLYANSSPSRLQRLGSTTTFTDLDVRHDVSVAPGGFSDVKSACFIILLTTPRGY